MPSRLGEIFEDEKLVDKNRKRLPYLFQLAELESSRAGKVEMEVGSLREKILIALLIFKFGEENVETEVPITEREIDAKLFGRPISIKTITGACGVKISWTVDAQKAREFLETYTPTCDVLLVQINWNRVSNFLYIPVEVQQRTLKNMGREKYLKLPKPRTNPRGVEISREGLLTLMTDKYTKSIKMAWKRSEIEHNPISDGLIIEGSSKS